MKKNFAITNHESRGLMENFFEYNGFYIYYENDLKIKKGENYVLFGYAYGYDKCHQPELYLNKIDNNISKSTIADIEEELYFWGGRYVLLLRNCIFMDYAGLLGLYWCQDGNDWIVTSSLNLLYEKCGFSFINNRPEFKWGQFINYFPAPYTQLMGVMKLINTQYIEISNSGGGGMLCRQETSSQYVFSAG